MNNQSANNFQRILITPGSGLADIKIETETFHEIRHTIRGYSDKELNEFKQLVLSSLNEARTDYRLILFAISRKRDHKKRSLPTFKLSDNGPGIFTIDEIVVLAHRQKKLISQLEEALIRIQNKTYGICKITGNLISKERLRNVPHTTLELDPGLEFASMN